MGHYQDGVRMFFFLADSCYEIHRNFSFVRFYQEKQLTRLVTLQVFGSRYASLIWFLESLVCNLFVMAMHIFKI